MTAVEPGAGVDAVRSHCQLWLDLILAVLEGVMIDAIRLGPGHAVLRVDEQDISVSIADVGPGESHRAILWRDRKCGQAEVAERAALEGVGQTFYRCHERVSRSKGCTAIGRGSHFEAVRYAGSQVIPL